MNQRLSRRAVLAAPLLAAAPALAQQRSRPRMLHVYVGTYTRPQGSKGIYRFTLDLSSGAVTDPVLVAETVNPSFLAVSPDRRYLYACNEIGDYQGTTAGAVSAFALDAKSGALTFLNQESSKGGAPCHLVVDKTGKNVLVANYGGGSVAVLPVQSGGRLGPASAFVQHEGKSVNERRQEGPHAHSINVDANNRFAVAADLGLDKLLVYRFDPAKGTLAPNATPFATVEPGSGPRHFAFHPDGRRAYVINEITCTVTAFDYDARAGKLTSIQTISTLPGPVQRGYSTAEVQVHPSGKFLYGSNRGHHSIAMFSIEPGSGRLLSLGHHATGGQTPRNFGIDPTGQFLLAANQQSDRIVVFRIDPKSGGLTPTGNMASAPTPVCVKFVPVA